MADKYVYLDDVAKKQKEREATVTSAGAGNAGDIVALDAAGLLDVTVLPVGVGPDVDVIATSENLSDTNMVNIYDAGGGTQTARKADSSNAREAHGFVTAATTSPDPATVYFEGICDGFVGLTPGAVYYLDAAGAISDTPETTSTGIWQKVGVAISDTELSFEPGEVIVRA